jgi:flagellar basal-body rod modification protein FlgD
MQVHVSRATAAPAAETAAATTTSTKKDATLNYDAFLQLLIAEMKSQDPTKPADTAAYMGQLASFSAVEQGIKTNKKLDDMMTSMAFTQAGSLIGRTVTSADGKVTGTVKSLEIYTDGTLVVLDSGKKVLLEPGVKIT